MGQAHLRGSRDARVNQSISVEYARELAEHRKKREADQERDARVYQRVVYERKLASMPMHAVDGRRPVLPFLASVLARDGLSIIRPTQFGWEIQEYPR